MEHGDSLGNRGAISAGNIQWMTAGIGIIHQEMPQGDLGGRMHGFQFMGQSSFCFEDDQAAVPGGQVVGNPADRAKKLGELSGKLQKGIRGSCTIEFVKGLLWQSTCQLAHGRRDTNREEFFA